MRRWIIMAAMAALAGMALAGTASADVPRYQTQTATFTVTQPYGAVGQWDNVWTHTYTVTVNPCDGSFTGTGVQGNNVGDPYTATETITGTFGPASVSFTAVRPGDGVSWTLSNAPFGEAVTLATVTPAVSWPVEMKVTAPVFTATSEYRNHGQYVKAMGGGSDAAHSCIGKPIPYSWSTSGTIETTAAGTAVTLPVEGQYRIDVSGTWTNGSWGWVDAEYTNDGAGGFADGFDRGGYLLGPNFGDLMVGGTFVNWGVYSPVHTYSYTGSFAAGALSLTVFDGEGGVAIPGWYGDNTGGLDYTITYVGP